MQLVDELFGFVTCQQTSWQWCKKGSDHPIIVFSELDASLIFLISGVTSAVIATLRAKNNTSLLYILQWIWSRSTLKSIYCWCTGWRYNPKNWSPMALWLCRAVLICILVHVSIRMLTYCTDIFLCLNFPCPTSMCVCVHNEIVRLSVFFKKNIGQIASLQEHYL